MRERFADAVVVAAGASRRMGGFDKLEAPLAGRPLLAWSLEAMAAARSVRRVIVVAAPERVDRLAAARWLPGGVTVVSGGPRRADSVLAGVSASDAPIVLIHDGARPLVTPELADAVAAASAEHGAAIPILASADSLKRVDGAWLAGSVERDAVVRAQTPQGARRELLLEAYAAAGGRAHADEAGLLEAHGWRVATVAGEATNLKVTEPADLEIVQALAHARLGAAPTRTGFGQDSHTFGREDGLWLCGVLVDHAPRLHGHSDGDAGLHALATAILSGSGHGDLGQLFPASDASTSGTPSSRLLAVALDRCVGAGWRPAWVQLALLGARPRLGRARLEEMRRTVAALLELDEQQVAVSASTGNLTGAEGAGRAIAATALVTLARA